jgi:phospholipid/cholesterol/gamma-HCH transport system ATP-binding protein
VPESVHPPAVVVDNVSFAFDDHVVLDGVSFSLAAGKMLILLGGSGSGKSILLKLILGLLRPDAGAILVHGHRVDQMNEQELLGIRGDTGMLFQETALFDSLTVGENVGYRLYEESDMPIDDAHRRVETVLGFVGLNEHVDRMPSSLSGGQRRRVAIARAMAAQPDLILFDDPTVGLDPTTATTITDQIVKLRDLEHVTSIVVTHQIRDAVYLATHEARPGATPGEDARISPIDSDAPERATFMVLHEGKIYFEGSSAALRASRDPYLQAFLFMTLPPW